MKAKQLDDGVGDTFVLGGCEWQGSRLHFYLCLDISTISLNDSRASEGTFTNTASFSFHELRIEGKTKRSKDREPSRDQAMSHAEEIRKGKSEIPFPLAIFESKRSRRKTDGAAADLAQAVLVSLSWLRHLGEQDFRFDVLRFASVATSQRKGEHSEEKSCCRAR